MNCWATVFKAASRVEVEDLVRRAESTYGATRWVLFVRRGPVGRTIIQDGTLAEVVVQATRPTPPYAGYVFVYGERPDERLCELEMALRRETAAGTYNLVASARGVQSVVEATAPAFWN